MPKLSVMKAYGRVEIKLRLSSILALGAGEWSASRWPLGGGGDPSDTCHSGGQEGPRTVPDSVEMRKLNNSSSRNRLAAPQFIASLFNFPTVTDVH
jgi:hypothetical protein